MASRDRVFTTSEFEAFIKDHPHGLYELIHGEIIQKLPTEEHGIIAARISARLLMYVEDNRLGRVTTESRYRPVDDTLNDRLPDVAFTAGYDRPVVKKGPVNQLPDLAIEIKSPSDTYRHMRETADFYIANGSQVVWLIFPDQKLIEIHRLNQKTVTLTEDEILEDEPLLPGFSLHIRVLFQDL